MHSREMQPSRFGARFLHRYRARTVANGLLHNSVATNALLTATGPAVGRSGANIRALIVVYGYKCGT